MTRTIVNPGRLRTAAYIGDSATMDLRVIDMRDRVKTALDPGDTGNTWKISDVVKWTGTGTYKGYAFIVQHRDGAGNPTGKEWLFLLPGDQGTEISRFLYYFGNSNNANCDDFFEISDGTLDFNNNARGVIAVHYNDKLSYTMDLQASGTTGSPAAPEAIQVQGDATRNGTLDSIPGANNWIVTQAAGARFKPGDILEAPGSGATFTVSAINNSRFYDMGFDDFDAMTLAGGDLSAPGSNPYSAHTVFMPNEQLLLGMVFGRAMNTGVYPTYGIWVFDDQKPFFAYYHTYGLEMQVRTAFVSGEIVNTLKGVGVDDFKSGNFLQRLRVDQDESGISEGYSLQAYYGDHPDGNGGARASWNYRTHTQFTMNNSPRESDGKFPFEVVGIDNNDEFKGSFDPDIIANIGAYNDHYQFVFAGGDGPLVKYGQFLAFPWVTDEGVFPPVRWDTEPDDSLLSE